MALASVLLWAWLRPDPLVLARQQLDSDRQPETGTRAQAAPGKATSEVREPQVGTVRVGLRHLRHSPRAAFAFMTIVVANTVMGAVMTMTPVSSLVAGPAMLSDATPTALRPGVQGTTDTAMNVVAAVGAGLAGPLMHSIGFGGLNAAAAALVLPVLLFWLFLARAR
jgi:hypothetical protein